MTADRTVWRDRPEVDAPLLILRLVVGVIFKAHGSQKLLGAFGGPGLETTIKNLDLGPLGYLVVIGEFFGGLGLIVGFMTRFSAASLIVIMIGAVAKYIGRTASFSPITVSSITSRSLACSCPF